MISIHAPAEGATNKVNVKALYNAISIHAPAEGATMMRNLLDKDGKFQSTLPRRERQKTRLGWSRY